MHYFLVTKLTPIIATAIPAKCPREDGSCKTPIANNIVSAGPTEPMTAVRVAPIRMMREHVHHV